MSRSICSVDGCNNIVTSKGLCEKHKIRLNRFGDVNHRGVYDKNEIIVDGDVCTMFLYDKDCKKIAETIFNYRHLEKVKNYKWCVKDKNKYVMRMDGGKYCAFHRVITDAPAKFVVDHIDGNTLNNLDSNLRIIEKKFNFYNAKLSKNNKSGHNGVSFMSSINKWRAYIMVDRKQISLGCHNTLEDAIQSRKEAEITYFGEFSRLYGKDVLQSKNNGEVIDDTI